MTSRYIPTALEKFGGLDQDHESVRLWFGNRDGNPGF